MIQVIDSYEKEFATTPRSGWVGGKFYLISSGGRMKRVYSATCKDIPAFAWKANGAPAHQKSAVEKVCAIIRTSEFDNKEFVSAVDALSAAEFDTLPIFVIGTYNRAKNSVRKMSGV